MHKYKLQAQRPMKFSNDNKKPKGDCGDYLRNIGSSWMKNINDLQDRQINTLVSTQNNINWVGENGNRTYRIKNFKTKIFTSLVKNQRKQVQPVKTTIHCLVAEKQRNFAREKTKNSRSGSLISFFH